MAAQGRAWAGQRVCEQAWVLSLTGLKGQLSLSWGPSWNEDSSDPGGGKGGIPSLAGRKWSRGGSLGVSFFV